MIDFWFFFCLFVNLFVVVVVVVGGLRGIWFSFFLGLLAFVGSFSNFVGRLFGSKLNACMKWSAKIETKHKQNRKIRKLKGGVRGGLGRRSLKMSTLFEYGLEIVISSVWIKNQMLSSFIVVIKLTYSSAYHQKQKKKKTSQNYYRVVPLYWLYCLHGIIC